MKIGDVVIVSNSQLMSFGRKGEIIDQEGRCYKVRLDQLKGELDTTPRTFKFNKKNLRKVEIETMPVQYTEIKVTKEEDKRELVAFTVEGDDTAFLLLTENQIKLLYWLSDNEYFNDYVTIQKVDQANIVTV